MTLINITDTVVIKMNYEISQTKGIYTRLKIPMVCKKPKMESGEAWVKMSFKERSSWKCSSLASMSLLVWTHEHALLKTYRVCTEIL